MGKKFWLALLGGFLTMFILSGLFHQVVAAGWLERTFGSDPGEVHMPGIVAFYIIVAFMMAWMYPKGYAGGGAMVEGLRFGLAVGVLVHISSAILGWAVAGMGVGLGSYLAHGIWLLVETAAGGVVIGKIYGETEAETVAAESPAPETPAPEAATPETTEPAEESSEETA